MRRARKLLRKITTQPCDLLGEERAGWLLFEVVFGAKVDGAIVLFVIFALRRFFAHSGRYLRHFAYVDIYPMGIVSIKWVLQSLAIAMLEGRMK